MNNFVSRSGILIGIILLRDEAQKLEIKVTLDSDKLDLLRDRLKAEN